MAGTGLPFLMAMALFALGYLGLAVSLWPYVVPPGVTIWQAASPPSSQLFLLIGMGPLIPVILIYTGWSYWVFRGKVRPGEGLSLTPGRRGTYCQRLRALPTAAESSVQAFSRPLRRSFPGLLARPPGVLEARLEVLLAAVQVVRLPVHLDPGVGLGFLRPGAQAVDFRLDLFDLRLEFLLIGFAFGHRIPLFRRRHRSPVRQVGAPGRPGKGSLRRNRFDERRPARHFRASVVGMASPTAAGTFPGFSR